MQNYVVARHIDGRLVKGATMNVDATKTSCHVRTADGRSIEVHFSELKALFFVKSLAGDPSHNEGMEAQPSDLRLRGSHLLDIRFADGERMVALANRFPPVGPYFFVVPVDTRSNNVRVLVNRAQIASLEKVSTAA